MAYGTVLHKSIYYNSPLFIKNLISSVYGWQQSRKRYGKFYHQYFKSLSKSQWFSKEKLEEIQFKRSKEFIINTNNHSEFYHDLFLEYNFQPEKMQSLTDLNKLPILDKLTIKKNLQKIINNNLKKVHIHLTSTGGTTGTALIFPETLECFQREYAFRYLQYAWSDIKRGQKFACCGGQPVAYHNRQVPPFWTYDYTNNWLLLSSYHISEKNLIHYISELEKFQPEMIQGYPSSLYLLAIANQHAGNRIRPKSIVTGAETLFNFQRDIIEKSFGCKAYNLYGNGEKCGFIAQCEKGKYHVKMEHSYIEILDKNNQKAPPGVEGRMICTGFGNYATPFIRYDIGDVAILSEKQVCDCGRGGTIVDQVIGRTDDYVLTPEGNFVERLGFLFHNELNVRMAQIIQKNINEVIIKIVKEPKYSTNDEKKILNKAIMRLGSKIKISFEYADEIPRTKNGKHRFIVSKINKKELFNQLIE